MKEPDGARHLKKVATTLKLWEADLEEATTTDQPGPLEYKVEILVVVVDVVCLTVLNAVVFLLR